jgi:putative DNA primase/helicase
MLNPHDTYDSAFVNEPETAPAHTPATIAPAPASSPLAGLLSELLGAITPPGSTPAEFVGSFLRAMQPVQQRTAAQPSKPKGPAPDSIELQFSDLVCLTEHFGRFCIDTETAANGSVPRRWNGAFWEYMGPDELNGLAATWLGQAHRDKKTKQRIVACRECAEADLRSSVRMPTSKRTKHEIVLSLPGKYLAVSADTIRCIEPDPEHGLTFGITKLDVPAVIGQSYKPRPVPEDSRFFRWFANAQPDPSVRDFIQLQAALALLPECSSHAVWWCGEGNSGKSTIVEMISSCVSSVARTNFDNMAATQFGFECLVGKDIVCIDEVDGGLVGSRHSVESPWKSLVSGNGVGIPVKFGKDIPDYHSKSQWFITSNPSPRFRDRSNGCWRRTGAVLWSRPIADTDVILNFHDVLLAEEGHIFFDWLLIGLQRLIAHGRKMPPESKWPSVVRAMKHTMKSNADSVLAWVEGESVHVTGPNDLLTKDLVYQRYLDYCRECFIKSIDVGIFFRELRGRLGGDFDGDGVFRTVDGKRKRVVNCAWYGTPNAGPAIPPPPAPSPVPSPSTLMTPTERDAMLMSTGRNEEPCSEEDFMFPEIPKAAGGKV